MKFSSWFDIREMKFSVTLVVVFIVAVIAFSCLGCASISEGDRSASPPETITADIPVTTKLEYPPPRPAPDLEDVPRDQPAENIIAGLLRELERAAAWIETEINRDAKLHEKSKALADGGGG